MVVVCLVVVAGNVVVVVGAISKKITLSVWVFVPAGGVVL